MIVVACSMAVAALIAWLVRPRPTVRLISRRLRSRRWLIVPIAAVVIVTSPLLGLVATIGAVAWRRWSSVRRSARTLRQISTDFPDALDLMVLSIRAGYLPAQAITEIIPYLPPTLRGPFSAVGTALRDGERFADALDQLSVHLGPIGQPLIDSLAAADRYGLPLAPVLERLAFEARQQRRRDADAAARELPVRLAMPLVLCTLPSFVLLAIVPLLLGALSSLHT